MVDFTLGTHIKKASSKGTMDMKFLTVIDVTNSIRVVTLDKVWRISEWISKLDIRGCEIHLDDEPNIHSYRRCSEIAEQLKAMNDVIVPAAPGFSVMCVDSVDTKDGCVDIHETPVLAWRIRECGQIRPVYLGDQDSERIHTVFVKDPVGIIQGIFYRERFETMKEFTAYLIQEQLGFEKDQEREKLEKHAASKG